MPSRAAHTYHIGGEKNLNSLGRPFRELLHTNSPRASNKTSLNSVGCVIRSLHLPAVLYMIIDHLGDGKGEGERKVLLLSH